MRKIVFAVAFLFVFAASNAQKDFQGMAVYESKTSTADFKKRFEGNKDITPDMQKTIEERMKKMFEKTFILNFDKQASIYKEEEKLDAPGQGNGGGMRMMSNMMGGGGTYYKDVKQKAYSVDKEFMGKEFLIKDSLKTYKWVMEAETRQIGGYTCYKATTVIPASKTDFRNYRPRADRDNAKKDNSKKEDSQSTDAKATDGKEKKTSFLDEIDLPKEITITAWYTPEIPINQGPEGYWGLPGLILEVNDGKTIILCSKVVLNAKDKADIKAPTKGKVVSQKEYDDTIIKKMEEFRQMNSGPGDHGGPGRGMRFGG